MRRSTAYTFLRATVVVAFLILAGRLWYMQIVRVNAYRAQAIVLKSESRPILAPRGIIYDRNGKPLTRNLPSLNVSIIPDQWPSRSAKPESRFLSRLLSYKPGAARIRHIVASHQISPTSPVIIKANLGLRRFYLVRSHLNVLPGVYADETLGHREYLPSAGWSMAHILGYTEPISAQQYKIDGDRKGPYGYQHYTAADIAGQGGLELVYDHYLHGINGLERAQIDAFGNQVTPWKVVRRIVPGDGLRLTISTRLENEATDDLSAGIHKLNSRQGAAVLMNPWNGQVLAIVSLPSFNPNIFTAAPGPRRTREISAIYKNPAHPLFDVATQSAMPPGSIYKVVTATAGLAQGVITPSTVVDDTGTLQRCSGCPVFHGWDPHGLGTVNVVHALEMSSDIFFYQVAGGGPAIAGNGLGPYRLGKWAHRYGLGSPTGIGLPGEASGLVPSVHELWRTQHRPWSYGDSYNMGIGQGDNLVTPIQMARVVSAIANGGNLLRPQIVSAVTTQNGRTSLPGKNFGLVPDVVRRHFVAPWILGLIREGMRLGVTSPQGTSHWNVDLRNQAAGKTGTSQAGTNYDGWWIGFAPYNHPKIAVAVVVPDSGAEGAFSAAPIGSKIIDDYFHITDPSWLNQVQRKVDFVN